MAKTIFVSNRLPIVVKRENEQLKYHSSSGGLATGLKSLLEKEPSLWVGFPGIVNNKLNKKDRADVYNTLREEYHAVPVFLDAEDVKMYYDGFSNKTLWPLFHYFQSITVYDSKMWEAYQKVNGLFFDEVMKIIEPEDTVWVHDYQLMLLPKLLRDKIPDLRIGFFLHIPFPSFESFRLIPWREELLEGVLGSDLIGFHTISYVRHFLNSVQFSLGIENVFGSINIDGRSIKVDTFPMGIDYETYSKATKAPEVQEEIQELGKSLTGLKTIISIDRLDYTKGLLQRLESFDYFLERYPEYKEKVTLIMVAVPSRTQVEEYNNLTNKLEILVSRINGKYSTLSWVPIRYLYRAVPFNTIMALYRIADVALITPLRDGMNLVAKEYVAAKVDSTKGVLIISEMAGVAEELGEALKINPNHKAEIAETLNEALSMPEEKQSQLLEAMQERLKRNDVFKWANDFMEKLAATGTNNFKQHVNLVSKAEKAVILERYRHSPKRLLFLDYDGTLVGFQSKPENAYPDAEVLKIFENLARNPKNRVAVISGRDRKTLSKWLGHLNIALVAEHGAWIRETGGDWQEAIIDESNWIGELRPMLEIMVDRTPNSYIEEKAHALVWHYRNADPDLASIRLRELKSNLLNVISNMNLMIMEGNKILEIKRVDIDKGKIAHMLRSKEKPDFIMALGDDLTDEDMFKSLKEKEEAFTIKVGLGDTFADYYLPSYKDVRKLLAEIAKIDYEEG